MPIIDVVANFLSINLLVVNNNNATIEILSELNYKRWRLDIEYTLRMMDLDMALHEDEPPKPIDESIEAKRANYA